MKNKALKVVTSAFLLVCLAVSLIVSCGLMINMGIYVDEAGTSPVAVCGGDFWLSMEWLKLALLALATIVAAVRLVVDCLAKNAKAK